MADVIDLARVKDDLKKIKRYEISYLQGDAPMYAFELGEEPPTGRAAAWAVISLGILLVALIVTILLGCAR